MKQTVLVTGGAGFIGSHLCEFLLNEDKYVICVDNLITGDMENIREFLQNKNFEFINHDIVNPLKVDRDINEIYHLACPASPIDYQNIPIETLLTSSMGTKNVLDLALEKKARLLFTSTSEIYGDPLVHPQPESYFGNVNTLGPRSCYDEGKRFAESLVVNYAKKYNLDTKLVRIFNTYGPKMRKNDGRVIPNFINQALHDENITVYGEGKQTRSFCYVDDLIKGIIKTMEKDNFSGPVNIGNNREITILKLAEEIIKLTGSKSKVIFKSLPQDDPKTRCPDLKLAKETLGFEPRISLEEGLKKVVEWFYKL